MFLIANTPTPPNLEGRIRVQTSQWGSKFERAFMMFVLATDAQRSSNHLAVLSLRCLRFPLVAVGVLGRAVGLSASSGNRSDSSGSTSGTFARTCSKRPRLPRCPRPRMLECGRCLLVVLAAYPSSEFRKIVLRLQIVIQSLSRGRHHPAGIGEKARNIFPLIGQPGD